MSLDWYKNIDKDNKNTDKMSDKEILQQTKDTLRYLWRDVKDRLNSWVDTAKENFSKSLQSLDKWLSWEKEQEIADVHNDLSHLRDDVISHPKDPLDRPSSVKHEIAQRATWLKNHILDDAANDDDFVAAGIGKLMKYIMQTEK